MTIDELYILYGDDCTIAIVSRPATIILLPEKMPLWNKSFTRLVNNLLIAIGALYLYMYMYHSLSQFS